ncbi:hypothetical protein NJT12_14640 [Flavobacterium sp. AC]|uniref:Uncharacterized protein n=1 Tax=Flavobacterium azizsancarii TaxID=2961580 RepID=A0ABT4WE40_9FLAO|nr:hypothetical protein [Flavobacterium azizsancarii]MDA6070853.1 hypothetical protein [Flavobacterium azizsancarii]
MSIWITELGLRHAQYLGGYRYVTSVQRYDFKSINDLKIETRIQSPDGTLWELEVK